MKLSAFRFPLLALLLSGCATPNPNDVAVAEQAPILTTGTIAHAVCIGLTNVLPAAYDGWAGECPGCDQDALAMQALCKSAGAAHVTLLLNAQATCAAVEAAIQGEASGLRSNDLLIVTYSGHGGQVPDEDGDEVDGLDETICLYDGQMIDDHIKKILLGLQPGLRILLIADSCHSEGNFRAFVRAATKVVTLGKYGHKKIKPLLHRKTAGRVPLNEKWDKQLIEFAGCREDAYSYGGAEGGKWSLALAGAYGFAPTLRAFFDAAKKNTPDRQQPQWVECGPVTDAFRFSVPLK